MKKVLVLLVAVLLSVAMVPVISVGEGEVLTREEAAVMLSGMFALADVHPSMIPTYETTPRNMMYTATNGAINTINVIPAAKDCVMLPSLAKIEAVINAGLMVLEADNLSFKPYLPVTYREFAAAIARGLYGVDLEIDHVLTAIEMGVFDEADITDEIITVQEAQEWVDAIAGKMTIIAVFATSDIHGNYLPYTSSDGKFHIGSVARMKTIMDEVRNLLGDDNVLFVDGGDSPYNTTLANVTLGDVSVAALSALGLDATVLGNHDFDYSFENLLRLANDAEYAVLSANTKYKEGYAPQEAQSLYPEVFKDYIVRKTGSAIIGILGVTDDESAATTLYTNTAEITWDNDLEKASQVVDTLINHEDCDIIIALSHLHGKNPTLLMNNPAISISIGGGNDIAGRPVILGDNQYLINPGKHGEAITQINLVSYDGRITGLVHNQIFLTDAYDENADIKALVDSYNARVDEAMDEIIGYIGQNLEWSTEMVRCQNSPIANLVTDALLNYFQPDGADLCIVNGGGIRAKLDEGGVSLRQVAAVLPFDNNMMLVETSGQTIWDALQNGISAYPAANGKFPQVAGMSYSFVYSESDATSTLLTVTLTDGTPLDMAALYKVVINSFLAGGGDGYTMLNVLDETNDMATDVEQLVYVNKTYMRDALQAYFTHYSSVEQPIVVNLEENRIIIE
jgi:2',3'-cyclic-nucleotide 2'-phosphodiesterase (5'-nucleotidase family)